MHAQIGEPESMHARMWGGLLQDTDSPMGDMVHLFIYLFIYLFIFIYSSLASERGMEGLQRYVMKRKALCIFHCESYRPFGCYIRVIVIEINISLII